MENSLTTLLLKIPRNTEITPEPAQTFLAALTQINSVTNFERFRGKKAQALSLEIVLAQQQIKFLITCSSELTPFVEAQLQSNYPLVIIQKISDPILEMGPMHVKTLGLRKGSYHPIQTYPSFSEVDPLSSVLSVLSNATVGENAVIQYSLESISGSWQSYGQKMVEKGIVDSEGGRKSLPDEAVIKEKVSFPGFSVSIRLAAGSANTLNAIASAFGVYSRTDGNSFGGKSYPFLARKNDIRDILSREVRHGDVLNIHELATLWHLPGLKVKTASILWGHSVLSEAPENLPTAETMTEEEKQKVNFFARTRHRNQDSVFGIRDKDRGRHIWVVGKTGTGKSTLIANMVIDDIKKGRGVGVIDPHGDLVETVLNYIPSDRINQTVYFNPADREFPLVINPLEVKNKEEGELVVSGLMSVFTKIWANVWSARMEYVMRNSLLTLTEIPNATLADVLNLLADPSYRNYVVNTITDPALKSFWIQEYNKMPERLQTEAISPIQNKVGQFITSPMIRRIIGRPKSTVDLKDVMDNGMIFLANLSQGRLGEDNATLLGATLITKFQLAAMNRVDTKEADRVPFNLFVDEFQNFATESFIKILSEARKYKLNLMLANQYMAQIPEEVQKAILGNVGSMVSFRIGAEDAGIIHKEFGEVFSENDLVNLANFQIAARLMIDNHSSRPFLATTLPEPASINSHKDTVIEQSRQRWSRKVELDEKMFVKPVYEQVKPPPQQNQWGGGGGKPNYNNKPRPQQYGQQGGFQRATPQGQGQHQQKPQETQASATHKPFAMAFTDEKENK